MVEEEGEEGALCSREGYTQGTCVVEKGTCRARAGHCKTMDQQKALVTLQGIGIEGLDILLRDFSQTRLQSKMKSQGEAA